MLRPVEFPDFGGLDLRTDPQEVGLAAVDLYNVAFDETGVIRTRPGTSSAGTVTTGSGLSLRLTESLFLGFVSGNVYGYSGPGGIYTTTGNAAYAAPLPIQIVASPVAATTGYTATGNSSAAIRKIDASGAPVVSSPAGIPTGKCVAIQSPDMRLVVGDAGNNAGRVAFSDPGDPETFGANNFVSLPGSIASLVPWNDLLFAFTSTALYVFYGNSVDSAGEPIFNYRLVGNILGGIQIATTSPLAAVGADDGVYFVTRSGVYRTTGGPPTVISTKIAPLFTPNFVPPYITNDLANIVVQNPPGGPVWADDRRLYVGVLERTCWLVYDFSSQEWSWWKIAGTEGVADGAFRMMTAMRVPTGDLRPIWTSSSTTIMALDLTATSDLGTAIASRYRSGFWNPGKPMVESKVREWLVDGVGTPTFSVVANDTVTLPTGVALTLGTSPAVGNARDRRAIRGRNFSWQLSATSGAWSASRVVANVANQRDPGTKS